MTRLTQATRTGRVKFRDYDSHWESKVILIISDWCKNASGRWVTKEMLSVVEHSNRILQIMPWIVKTSLCRNSLILVASINLRTLQRFDVGLRRAGAGLRPGRGHRERPDLGRFHCFDPSWRCLCREEGEKIEMKLFWTGKFLIKLKLFSTRVLNSANEHNFDG